MSCAIASLHAARDMERGGNCECEHCSNDCGCVMESDFPKGGPTPRFLISREKLRAQIIDDPDLETEAGRYDMLEDLKRRMGNP
jgi:hypothetical protein